MIKHFCDLCGESAISSSSVEITRTGVRIRIVWDSDICVKCLVHTLKKIIADVEEKE